MSPCVAIVGAGPYGLSIAAHLRARGIPYRIFGVPMQTWRDQMPRNMHLKSEGFASSLYEPSRQFTLQAYCRAHGLPYADIGSPVPREVFYAYGMAFQTRYVPDLDQRNVARCELTEKGYAVRLEDGETLSADKVVVAVGISNFAFMPPVIKAASGPLVTHASQHADFDRFAGKDVTVIGGGASAIDVAAALLAAGASVRVAARRDQILYNDPPRERTLGDKIRAPMSGLGPGWRSRLCTDAPLVFHMMPEGFRTLVVKKHLGPAPCWFTRDEVEGKAAILLQTNVKDITVQETGLLSVGLLHHDGSRTRIQTDHLIAATGYRVDLAKLSFLDSTCRRAVRLADTSPALSMNFESSVKGLYFVGLAAANSFGPLSRFAFGAGFTARRLSAHFARRAVTAVSPWQADAA